MDDGTPDLLPPVEALPRREPADHEVAAGAIAGLAGGAAMLLAALAASDQGSFFPLRLVAASFLGHAALDPGAVVPVLVGAVLGALPAVAMGLVFTSILPRAWSPGLAVAAGLAFGAVAWLVAWFALVRLSDPVLFAAVPASRALPLHLLHGAVAGLLLPPLRRVLP
jgi:hypothetical protein